MTDSEQKEIQEYEDCIKEYKQRWSIYNDSLHDLCSKYPHHTSLPHVIAKVGIISRSYSAGLERQANSNSKEGAIYDVANEFVKNQTEIDCLFDELRKVASRDDHYNSNIIPVIVETHYKILQIVNRTTRDSRNPRSFVSKYMHFHVKGVPIFDSYVRTVLADWYSKSDVETEVVNSIKSDSEYSKYCLKFLLLWNETMDEKEKYGKQSDYVSVRHLDYYLQRIYYRDFVLE